MKPIALIEHRNTKRAPGWYWTFEGEGEPGGKCGPYMTSGAARRSARRNGFATRRKLDGCTGGTGTEAK